MRYCGSVPFEEAIAAWRKLLQSGYTLKEDPRRVEGKTVSKARRRAGHTNLCAVCGALPGEPGFVRFNWPVGHVYFGRPVQCPRCGGSP